MGLPYPSPGELPDPGTELWSPVLQADALPSEPAGKHTVLQINPEVTVMENRYCKDHSLEGKYKLSMQIIKPF